jgi:hypothetical protein
MNILFMKEYKVMDLIIWKEGRKVDFLVILIVF